MKNDEKKDISFKNKISIIVTDQLLSNDSEFELLSNYEEIIQILNNLSEEKKNMFMYLFFNKKKAHNILYNSDEVIDINSYNIENGLNYYFYLNLLIKENIEIINYSYSFDFINELYKIDDNLSPDNNLKKIVYSKFIIELINNFEGLDEYDEEIYDNKINEIKNNCLSIISDNIHFFKELNLDINENDIIDKKIDEIYTDIINSLIKTKKIEDYQNHQKIIYININSFNLIIN